MNSNRILIFTIGLFSATVFGCSSSDGPERVPVSGTVNVDGTALAEGDITFRPEDKTMATETIKILEGKFEGEVIPGKKRIEIRGYEEVTPDLPSNAPEAGTPVQKQILPPKYNDKSELSEDIASGLEPLSYDLTTK